VYEALQGLGDKIDSYPYNNDRTVTNMIRTTRIINNKLELLWDVNIKDYIGFTALHYSARYNTVEALKVLLARPQLPELNGDFSKKRLPEMEVNERNNRGFTALHEAVWHNAVDVLKELLTIPEMEVNKETGSGLTALHLAARHNRDEVVKELMKCREIRMERKTEGAIRRYMAMRDMILR